MALELSQVAHWQSAHAHQRTHLMGLTLNLIVVQYAVFFHWMLIETVPKTRFCMALHFQEIT